jgi:tRNA (guanine37-N1)-methyltransferase
MVGIARERGSARVEVHDLRRFATDRHRTVDDAPYGGGPGMVMRPEPLVAAIEALAGTKEGRAGTKEARAGTKGSERTARVILLSPRGRRLDQARVEDLAREEHLVLVCGRYEGVDQRVIDLAVDEEISIGDYVLSGGEVAAMAVIEAVTRLLPGVLGNPESTERESFRRGLLEGPQYTRPAEFRGRTVPEVLRSGDHREVARWHDEQARAATRERRPDLLEAGEAREDRQEKKGERT